MARTIQSLVDEVRRLTQDQVTPYRYSDDSIAALTTDFFGELQRQRPDAFVPYTVDSTTPEVVPANFSDPWPVSEQFFKSGVLYVFGYLELADDEHANTQRAEAALTRSSAILMGVV